MKKLKIINWLLYPIAILSFLLFLFTGIRGCGTQRDSATQIEPDQSTSYPNENGFYYTSSLKKNSDVKDTIVFTENQYIKLEIRFLDQNIVVESPEQGRAEDGTYTSINDKKVKWAIVNFENVEYKIIKKNKVCDTDSIEFNTNKANDHKDVNYSLYFDSIDANKVKVIDVNCSVLYVSEDGEKLDQNQQSLRYIVRGQTTSEYGLQKLFNIMIDGINSFYHLLTSIISLLVAFILKRIRKKLGVSTEEVPDLNS